MITVYWADFSPSWMLAKTPYSLSSVLANRYKGHEDGSPNRYLKCPAVRDHIKNVFCLESYVDYSFTIVDPKTSNITYSAFQEPFEETVFVRDINHKLFSFHPVKTIFFTDAPSLKVSGYLNPYAESNAVARDCQIVEGTFDIGKWFRPFDFAFFMRDDVNTFSIKRGDVYAYLRFHTEETIQFKRFVMSQDFASVNMLSQTIVPSYGLLRSLKKYYELPFAKKKILKAIKENLAE